MKKREYRTASIRFKLTESERAEIESEAKKRRMTITAFILMCVEHEINKKAVEYAR